jgi:pheromone a factor receptor
MAHPELAVGAFLACVLVLIPLPWQWRARNTPVLSMMAWLFATNLAYAIKAVIWYDSIDNVAPVLCDIGTSIISCRTCYLLTEPRCSHEVDHW